MPNNFQPGPKQDASLELKNGLKFQCFRRDPSKFFVEVPAWVESLNIGAVESSTITSDETGHLTLSLFYRTFPCGPSTVEILSVMNNTVGLVCDLADAVKTVIEATENLTPRRRPPVSGPEESQEVVAGAD